MAPDHDRHNTQTLPRIGHGWDLHRLEPQPPEGQGRPLVIGGVTLEHTRGPIAHSDGDALYHAVTDAILGALALPDIGQLFPNDDPRNESADSEVFLAEAIQKAHERGYRLGNLDTTVVLERPKLGPHKDLIKANLARILQADPSAVNLKGKTHERVDATGANEAVQAHAVVLLFPTGQE